MVLTFSPTTRSLRSSLPTRILSSLMGMPVVVSYRLTRYGASPQVISRQLLQTYSCHDLDSGNSIFPSVGIHSCVCTLSVLKTFFLPNQASSTRLFWALQIHEGVNTSALSRMRKRCSSSDLTDLGRMTLPLIPVICSTVIG